eukprot:UN26949
MGKNKYEVDVDPAVGLETFQASLFSLTNVPPDRQKILFRKTPIETNSDLAGLKNKARLKLIGSAVAVAAATEKFVFAEDMTAADLSKIQSLNPGGMENLGNTCYLNATVQCLKAIPEFNQALRRFNDNELNPSVSKELGALFTEMSKTEESITPFRFVSLFRQAFPRFASRSQKTGGFEQQDADEFLVELLNVLKRDKVKLTGGKSLDELFSGEFQVTESCKEAEEEKAKITTEKFVKLTCFIDKSISHLKFGLEKGLVTEQEKRSPTLNRNAIYQKQLQITKLPEFLNIQLSRFSWKQTADGGVNCKILRKVIYPFNLDVVDLCEPELKGSISRYRKAKLDFEDEQREKKQAKGINNLDELKKEDEKKKAKKAGNKDTKKEDDSMDVEKKDTEQSVENKDKVTESTMDVDNKDKQENKDENKTEETNEKKKDEDNVKMDVVEKEVS